MITAAGNTVTHGNCHVRVHHEAVLKEKPETPCCYHQINYNQRFLILTICARGQRHTLAIPQGHERICSSLGDSHNVPAADTLSL